MYFNPGLHAIVTWLREEYQIPPSSDSSLRCYDDTLRMIEKGVGYSEPDPTVAPSTDNVSQRAMSIYQYRLGCHPWLIRSAVVTNSYATLQASSLSRPESPDEKQVFLLLVEGVAKANAGRGLPCQFLSTMDWAFLCSWIMAIQQQVPVGDEWPGTKNKEPEVISTANQLSRDIMNLSINHSFWDDCSTDSS